MGTLVSDEARSWIGRTDPPITVEVSRREIVKYAVSTEQTLAKYLSGDEAPPMFVSALTREIIPLDELGPDGIAPSSSMPDLPLKRVMAGGIAFTFHRPIRPGDTLKITRTLSDITEKQGRSGPLIFVTQTITIETEDGEAVLDQKQTRILR